MPRNQDLRNSAQIAELAKQLFAGVVEDSSLAPVISTVIDAASPLISRALDDFVGAPLSSVPDERMNDRRLIQEMRQERIANTGRAMSDVSQMYQESVTRGIYRSLGYSDDEIENVRNTGTGKLIEYAAKYFDPTREGTYAINRSIARRTPLIDYTENDQNIESVSNRVSSMTSDLANGIYEDVYRKSDYGSLSFREVGEIASKLIEQGDLDSGSKDQTTRINAFREKLKHYGKTVEVLKNVFDGDVPAIMAQMDELTGGSVMAMGGFNLEDTAKQLEHMTLATGIQGGAHGQQFRSMVENFYRSGIAQVGGSEKMATEMARHYSYDLVNAPRAYGVSQEKLEQGFINYASSTAATGKNRVIAAAYDAFLLSRKGGDTEENRQAFLEETGGDYSTKNMHKIIEKYDKSGASIAERVNNPYLDELSESTFVTELSTNAGDDELVQIANEIPKKVSEITGLSEEELKEKGIDFNKPIDQIRRQLQEQGLLDAEKSRKLDAYGYEVGARVSAKTGTDMKTSWNMISAAKRGQKLRNQEFEEGGGVNLPGKGAEPVIAEIERNPNATVRDVVGAGTKGVDVRELEYTERTQLTGTPQEVEEVKKEIADTVEEPPKSSIATEDGKDYLSASSNIATERNSPRDTATREQTNKLLSDILYEIKTR